MKKPIITWNDLTRFDQKMRFDGEENFFNKCSETIQQKLIEKGLLIQNPVEDWESEGQKYCSGSFWTMKLRIKEIVDKLTSPPEPKERMIYIGTSRGKSIYIGLSPISTNWEHIYIIPESKYNELGLTCIITESGLIEDYGKLSKYEVKQ